LAAARAERVPLDDTTIDPESAERRSFLSNFTATLRLR
jgi:hypothetical protein